MKLKLYYSPGACSFAAHIALIEAKADFTLEKVNLGTHKTAHSENFYDINPDGKVPTIDLLDSGQRLTQNVAVLPFIADSHPSSALMPPVGTVARYHAMEWLGLINSEIHGEFHPYFRSNATADEKAEAEKNLTAKFKIVDEQLRHNAYIAGPNITVTDFYLFVMEQWLEKNKHPSAELSSVQRHMKMMRERPSVHQALKSESAH